MINHKHLSFFVAIVPIEDYNINWVLLYLLLMRRMIMEYLTTTEMAKIWNLSSRRISVLCTNGRIDGAIKKGKMWLLPADAKKPADARYKSKKEKE